jgi:hypothetical protein
MRNICHSKLVGVVLEPTNGVEEEVLEVGDPCRDPILEIRLAIVEELDPCGSIVHDRANLKHGDSSDSRSNIGRV